MADRECRAGQPRAPNVEGQGIADVNIVSSETASRAFVDLPYRLYRDEPAWRAPLRMVAGAQVDAAKNPAMSNLTPRFFTAERDGRVVGRIAAFINADHDTRYGAGTAFYGYFDCEADTSLEDALLGAAADWARAQGRERLIGPSMWSVNEECGLLVDGYQHPPAVMMPFGQPHYRAALERNGFAKVVDMLAYRADISEGAPGGPFMRRLRQKAERDAGITWRSMDSRNFKAEVGLAMDIFNDAWSSNWGFLPFSPAQIDHMAAEMKPIMFADGFWVASIDGEPVAFIWMIPDVNEAAHGFDGRLLPVNWARFLWRLKRGRVSKARIPLMGLRRDYQNTQRGLAAVAEICARAFDAGRDQGFTQCELSWILEDNEGIKGVCDIAGADPYKTYRIYGRDL